MLQLANRDELSKLLSDTKDLRELLPTLNSCCFIVNQSLKKVLNRAFKEKVFPDELEDDFAVAAATLQSMLCKELCASYGSQLVTILEYKDKASGKKPDEMEEYEWNRIQSKYNGAVEARADLDKILYHAFINISEHIKFQMNQLS